MACGNIQPRTNDWPYGSSIAYCSSEPFGRSVLIRKFENCCTSLTYGSLIRHGTEIPWRICWPPRPYTWNTPWRPDIVWGILWDFCDPGLHSAWTEFSKRLMCFTLESCLIVWNSPTWMIHASCHADWIWPQYDFLLSSTGGIFLLYAFKRWLTIIMCDKCDSSQEASDFLKMHKLLPAFPVLLRWQSSKDMTFGFCTDSFLPVSRLFLHRTSRSMFPSAGVRPPLFREALIRSCLDLSLSKLFTFVERTSNFDSSPSLHQALTRMEYSLSCKASRYHVCWWRRERLHHGRRHLLQSMIFIFRKPHLQYPWSLI